MGIYKPAVSYHQHPWTFRLVGLNLVIFIIVELTAAIADSNYIFYYALFDSRAIVDGQWWRLFTATLIHADFIHLIFNMIAMMIFGSMLESIVGGLLYLLIYFIGGVVANVLVFVVLIVLNQEYLSLGASGSIMAVIGACFSSALYMYTKTRQPIWKSFFTQLGVILLIQLAVDIVFPQNSMMTHIAGVVAGILLGYIIVIIKLQQLPR